MQVLTMLYCINALYHLYHIAWLTQGTPAHNALHSKTAQHLVVHLAGTGDVVLVVLACAGTDQLRNDTGSVPANLWRQAILRGHGGATRLPELATR